MEIADFGKRFIKDTPKRQEVEITIQPQTRSRKHDHKCRCTSRVIRGIAFEVRDGTKTYYGSGSTMPEIKSGKHIVGNDGAEEVLLLNTYEPALQMEYFPDDEIDTLLCNTPGTL